MAAWLCPLLFFMRYFLLSEGGDGVGLAMRLHAEGNEVRVFIRDPEAADRCKGLIETGNDYSWGDIVVADCTGMGALCDRFREHGAKVVGGSGLADKLEQDRQYAERVMRQCGILVPEARSFSDWESAERFIKDSEDRLVFKPEGRLAGIIPSYCASDSEELLESIAHFKSLVGESQPEFTLQQFIEGTCVSTEAWFDGEKFIRPFNHTIERKHFMDGDIGPSGGCTGNVVWPAEVDDPICRQTVLRLEGFLREHRYIGAIDINAVVNEEGVYALEFTPRFGYDAFPTFLYGLYAGEFGALLYSMAAGDGPESMDVADRFAAGVRISLPPWPTEKHKSESGVPIRGLEQQDLVSKFYPYEVSLENGKLVTSGGYGIIGVMNGTGESVSEAFARAYLEVSKVKIPDMQYRTDLGAVCRKDYRELERFAGLREDMGWVGVDLDKTLAEGSRKEVGEPIEKMANRVKRWVRDGKEVRIVTARANDIEESVKVYDWQQEHLGMSLEVTSRKDHEMVRLWDDRVEEVEPNTGERVAP